MATEPSAPLNMPDKCNLKAQENPCSLLPPSFLHPLVLHPPFTHNEISYTLSLPFSLASFTAVRLSLSCLCLFLPPCLCLLTSSPPIHFVPFPCLLHFPFHALLPRPCVLHWIKKTHPDIVQHLPLSRWQRPIVEYEDWHAADTHHLSQRYRDWQRGRERRGIGKGERARLTGSCRDNLNDFSCSICIHASGQDCTRSLPSKGLRQAEDTAPLFACTHG